MQAGLPDRTSTFHVSGSVLTIDRAPERRDHIQSVYRALCAGAAPAPARPAPDRLRELCGLVKRYGRLLSGMDHPGDNGRTASPVVDTRSVGGLQETDFVELWTDRINLRLALIECLADCSEAGALPVAPGRRKAMRLKSLRAGRNANRRLGRRRSILPGGLPHPRGAQ